MGLIEICSPLAKLADPVARPVYRAFPPDGVTKALIKGFPVAIFPSVWHFCQWIQAVPILVDPCLEPDLAHLAIEGGPPNAEPLGDLGHAAPISAEGEPDHVRFHGFQ